MAALGFGLGFLSAMIATLLRLRLSSSGLALAVTFGLLGVDL
jgi:hypothetical protein